MSQKPEALRLADVLEEYRLFADNYRYDSLVLAMVAEIERLRAELKGARKQEAAMYKEGVEAATLAADEIERLRTELEESEQKIRIWRATFLHAETERGAYKMECERLRAELEALRRQEPVAWVHLDGNFGIVAHYSEPVPDDWLKDGDTCKPLYLSPGAQSAPSVPDIDSIVDRICEFGYHDGERGEVTFNRFTLREGVEEALAPEAPETHEATKPAPSVPEVTAMVDAAMEATQHIHPPITRSQCKLIIEAAFAAAPEAPKRKPLTREEMDAATRDAADKLLDCIYEYGTASEAVGPAVRAIGRAVEAARGIKENSNDRSR